MYFIIFAIILFLLTPIRHKNFHYRYLNTFFYLKNKINSINIPNAYRVLDELHTVFNKHNVLFFLSEGTALGFKRNKTFITYDDDIDIAIFESDQEKINLVIKDLVDIYNYKYIVIPLWKNKPKYQLIKGKINIDIDLIAKNKQCITNFGSCNKIIPLVKTLDKIKINNKVFYIPKDKYFEYVYGKSWKIPIKNYKPEMGLCKNGFCRKLFDIIKG